MNPIDTYLRELDAALRTSPRRRERLVAEVRDHLEDAVDHHRAAGLGSTAAARRAVADLGPVGVVAGPANAAAGTAAMRLAPFTSLAAGVAVLVGLFVATRGRPPHGTLAGARLAVEQTTFFAGAIGLQLAVVTAACGAARAASLWRRAEAPVADRRFVLWTAAASISCTCFAGGMWAMTVIDGPAHLEGWHHAPLVVAAVILLGGGLVATVACTRLRINAADEASPVDTAPPGGAVLGLGERAIALVRAHGALACAGVAALAAAGAMSHAETTLAGAVPWGVAQALAVIVGFVVLGPRLGLRARAGERAQI